MLSICSDFMEKIKTMTTVPAPSPLTLDYVKLVRKFLRPIGAWPGRRLGGDENYFERFHRIYVPLQASVMLLGQIAYLVVNFKLIDFFDMGHSYITCFLTVLNVQKGVMPNFKGYQDISEHFYLRFHLMHFINEGPYYAKVNEILHKISYYFTVYMLTMMVSGTILFNLTPMYNNYMMGAFTNNGIENTTLEFSVYYVFPGYASTDHYYITTIHNYYLSFGCSFTVCTSDLYLSLMVFQIIGHIAVLRHNLEEMPGPKKHATLQLDNGEKVPIAMFDDEENHQVHKNITKYINHHKFIVSFTDDISNFFGPYLASYYLFILVSGCLLLLELSTGDPAALARYGPLSIILFGQLIQVSVVFEIVNMMSEKLIDAVYKVPWECMNTRNRRSILILLQRVQSPIKITAMGFAEIGVQSMAGIFKTTFSFFTFIRNSMKE